MTTYKLKKPSLEDDIVYRLRKSVQQNEPDRITNLLEDAAKEIEELRLVVGEMDDIIDRLERRLNE